MDVSSPIDFIFAGMNHLRFLLPFFFLVLAAGCNKLESEVTERWTEEQPKLVTYYQGQDDQRIKVKEEQFYEDGKLEYTGTFNANGKREGTWKYWYPNGNLWSTGQFLNGKRKGPSEVYYETGELRYKGAFDNDKEVGQWTFYKPDGTIYNEIDFDSYKKTDAPQ